MEAILKFNLSDESDKHDHYHAVNAYRWASIIENINQYRRTLTKYEDRESIPTDEIEQKLSDLIADYRSFEDA